MLKTRIAIDTEFTGLHADSSLISIALVSNCGKTFYAEFTDYNIKQTERMGCKQAVFDNLIFNDLKDTFTTENNYQDYYIKADTDFILAELERWLAQFESIEIFGDCISWDWVLFCDLFGGAFSIPKNIYYIPFDLANLFKIKNIDPDISRLDFIGGEKVLNFNYKLHNALTDAHIVLRCLNKLNF